MSQRNLFTARATVRSALLVIALVQALLIENLLLINLLAADNIYSVILFLLQLPQFAAFLAALVALVKNKSAIQLPLINALIGLYAFAFVLDIGGLVCHSIFAVKAASAHDVHTESMYAFVLFILTPVDALGVHFSKLLADTSKQEIEYMSTLAAPNA